MAKEKIRKRPPRKGEGRPRTVSPKKEDITPEMLRKIDKYARAQAKDTMIAEILGFDDETFKKEFSKRCRKQRALGKGEILFEQEKQVKAGNPTMLIWGGKQHLGQTDKAHVEHSGSVTLNDAAVALRIAKGKDGQ